MSRDMAGQVQNWLEDLGLGKYSTTFAENDVDFWTLPHLTEEDLKELGVTLGHRRVLLAAIASLEHATATALDVAMPLGSRAPPATAGPEADRRILSILFCDLVGSTQLAQQLDPEEMRDLSRRYQDAVAGAVTRYGGHVAKFLGDGVLAYFGWPMAYEDQAERAVRAGLEAVSAVPNIKPANGAGLQARVGIATGEVVVGDLVGTSAREEGAISGHTPGLAARLQTEAEPGQVLVAKTTRRLIGGAFESTELGKRALRGFARPQRIFRIVGERQVESRFEAAHGSARTTFVGRVDELGFLTERWRATCSGQGQVVFVAGEAGIGKSRLIEVLIETVADGPQELIRLQCSPYHVSSAFHPVIERISRVAGLASADDPPSRLDRLEHMLAESGEDVVAKAPIYAELLSLDPLGRYPPINLSPLELKERTLATLVERLVLIARRAPVLLVAEDMHWVDPSTLELFERLVTAVPDLPVMLVLTHRPEWRSDQLTGSGHVSTLSLGRLDRAHVARITGEILGAEPGGRVVEDIVARTDGVPLFVEELARELADREDGDPAAAMRIPATLQGSLMARLDRLSTPARKTAMVASVLGREFDETLLREVMGVEAHTLSHALDELRRTRIVVPSPVARGAHVFRHALIQDAAYHSMLISTRRSHHRRIAEALQSLRPESVEREPEIIARHFSEADKPALALPFWMRAARRALARSANFEAISHAEMALASAEKVPDSEAKTRETLEARLLLAQALATTGRLQESTQEFRVAAEAAQRQGDTTSFVEAALGLDVSLFLSNEPIGEAIRMLEAALDCLPPHERRTRCELLTRLARAHLLAGNGPEAHKHHHEAAALAEELDDPMSQFNLLVNDFLLPTAALGLERRDWREKLDKMVALSERLDDDCHGRGLSLDIFISAEMGDRDRMDTALNRLTELGESRQHMHQLWIARHGCALRSILDGDFTGAETQAEAALRLGRQTRMGQVEGVYGIQMFTIRREQRRLNEIAPLLRRLVDENEGERTWKPGFALLACELGFREPAGRILHELAETGFSFAFDAKRSTTIAYLAEVCVALGDERHAQQLYELLLPYADMTVTTGVTTVCNGAAGRYLGMLAGVLGDRQAAERHFETALAINTRMRAAPWLAHSRHDYATMLRRYGRHADTSRIEALRNAALEDARRLGMVALEARLVGTAH